MSSTPSLETFLAVTDEMLGLEEKWHSLSGACLRKISGYILFTISLMSCVSAQELSEIPARLIIPDGIPVKLRLAESVSSAHARVGDLLDFIVVKDVSVGGFTIIQAGTMARGSITGVKGRRFLGIGGKVSLKLDSVELFNGDRVGLRAKEEVKGGSRTKLMVGGMIVTSLIFLPATPVFLLTLGRACTVLKSTEVTARIDAGSSVLSAGLQRSQERSSELQEMMDYLPPRVFNREGREGDMLNLVFVAQQANLQEAFEHAGWVKTDKWGPALVWQLLRRGTHDTRLPMARFYLFGRVQDYSYALPDPAAVVSRRHHIRIWKTDYTLDGTPLWIGAATHDIAIEIAKRGRLINHRIDPEVDAERDFIGVNLERRRQSQSNNTYTASLQCSRRKLHPAKPITRTAEFFFWISTRSPSPGPACPLNHPYCGGDLAAYRRSGRVFPEQPEIAPLSQVIHKVASTTTLVSRPESRYWKVVS